MSLRVRLAMLALLFVLLLGLAVVGGLFLQKDFFSTALQTAGMPSLLFQKAQAALSRSNGLVLGIIGLGVLLSLTTFLVGLYWILRQSAANIMLALSRLMSSNMETEDLLIEKEKLGSLTMPIMNLMEEYKKMQQQLAYERRMREGIEEDLRSYEEKYALALRCVNDGLWEWDVKTGSFFISPVLTAGLGYGSGEQYQNFAAVLDLYHPEDVPVLWAEYERLNMGDHDMLDVDLRMRHHDGRYRWFRCRGRMLRNHQGESTKIVGISSEITTRKRTEVIMELLAKDLTGLHGEALYRNVVQCLSEIMEVDTVMLAQSMGSSSGKVQPLATWRDGNFVSDEIYDLAGTPCARLYEEGRLHIVHDDLQTVFPGQVRSSFLGFPILAQNGRIIGHIACKNTGTLDGDIPSEAIFVLLASRIAIELEAAKSIAA